MEDLKRAIENLNGKESNEESLRKTGQRLLRTLSIYSKLKKFEKLKSQQSNTRSISMVRVYDLILEDIDNLTDEQKSELIELLNDEERLLREAEPVSGDMLLVRFNTFLTVFLKEKEDIYLVLVDENDVLKNPPDLEEVEKWIE